MSTSVNLRGKRALVTGAGQGIGRGIALALAEAGAAVIVAGRTSEKVEKVAAEIQAEGGEALAIRCDVGVQADVEALFGDTVASFGGLDVLVNNAQSIPPNRRLQDVPADDVELALRTGPVATLRCMQAAFPHLRENGGSIVNLGSNTAIEGAPLFGAYAMAKEGIRGVSRVAAKEWGRFGIRVNVICPFGDSPSAVEFNQAHPDAARAILRSTALGRMGDCRDDIGRAVAALVSDDLGYLTGATLMLDGGLCIRS
jgi:NAD(P)-dependent dehydrogenase (short-subunit alcohol dehydrogenase family)